MSLCDFGLRSGDMMFTCAALYCPKLHSITFKWCNLSESAIIKGFHTFSRYHLVGAKLVVCPVWRSFSEPLIMICYIYTHDNQLLTVKSIFLNIATEAILIN